VPPSVRCGVAVGDERAKKSLFPGLLKDRYRPFGGDQRLVVAGDHETRAGPAGGGDQFIGRDPLDRRERSFVAKSLAGHPILAVRTMEIASHHAESQGVAAGMHVEERLFLDRIALQHRHIIKRHLQLAALVVTHLAYSPPSLTDQTAMTAGHAADSVSLRVPEPARYREAVERIG